MIELKKINDLQAIAGSGVHPHLFISALGTIGVLASLYVLQKNGGNFTQIMCHIGCLSSGGVSCICVYSPASKD